MTERLSPVWAGHVSGQLRAACTVRHYNGTYTTTVAFDLGVDTRTARRWLKRAAALGLVEEYNGEGETYWGTVDDDRPCDACQGSGCGPYWTGVCADCGGTGAA